MGYVLANRDYQVVVNSLNGVVTEGCALNRNNNTLMFAYERV